MKYHEKIGVFEFWVFICEHIVGLSHPACDGYVNQYGHVMIDAVIDHYLTGEFICTFTHMCKDKHFVILEGEEYARDLLKDKPLGLPQPEINTNATTLKIMHITDIHTDTKYAEGSIATCMDPFCCRNDSIVDSKAKIQGLAGKWGYLGKCDLPLITLMNFLKFVETDIKPDIIVWTGDNPSHDEWDSDTQQEALNISSFFTNILKEKFSDRNITIYPSIGNHEKFPVDQFYPFDDIKERPLLKFFGDLWRPWLDEEAYNLFVQYGYYTKKHLNTNLRIVSYNCLLCDILNFYLIKNPTDPNNQVDWLESTLRKAERDNEVVLLIGHIPSGDTSLLSECAKRYNALTDRFSHIIRAQLAGHTHFDEVKIIKEYFNPDKVAGVSFIAPSLTTSTYLNPSFRVFEVDSDTKIFKDYLQYRMNITLANSHVDNEPVWEVSYRASEYFGAKDLTDLEAIHQYVEKIASDDAVYQKTCRSFFTDGPQVEMYCDKQGKI
jgi:sphingomyelin phosphodiesterase